MSTETKSRWEAAGINPEELRTFLSSSLHNSLQEIAVGASEDLREYGIQIARDMIDIQGEPDPEKRGKRLAEAKGQLTAVAELQRVRLNQIAWREFDRVWTFGMGILDRTLAAAVLAI